MSKSELAKPWLAARFTIGDDGCLAKQNPFIVIISNQPLENRSLLLDLCRKGDWRWIFCWKTVWN